MNKKSNFKYRMRSIIQIISVVTGSLLCLAGLVLVLLGLTGSIEWVLQAGSLTSRIGNASPGVFFTLVGYMILRLNRNSPSQLTGTQSVVVEGISSLDRGDLGCLILVAIVAIALLLYALIVRLA
jgi:hypothetical protein